MITLYHGSTHDFDKIDVDKGKPFKDFGRGFYLSEVYEHAHNLAMRNRKIEETRLRAIGKERAVPVFIYVYALDKLEMEKLKVKQFATADREWLEFIIANRMHRARQHDYDVVTGPTADDDTRTSIRTVMNASNGAILSDRALDLLIAMLEPSNLPEQYYFGSNKAASLLKLMERREIK